MTTYRLRHRTRGFLLPATFSSRQQAERHRAYLDAVAEYEVYEQAERATESEDEWGDTRWSYGAMTERENEIYVSNKENR
jgi:hypothetical protein